MIDAARRVGVLFTDGGSRGNPGPSALGYVLTVGGEVIEHGEAIGHTTNNDAEWAALTAGMRRAVEENVEYLTVYADSQLVVRGMTGEYGIDPENEKFIEATMLADEFVSVTFQHIPRKLNAQADALVNAALDAA